MLNIVTSEYVISALNERYFNKAYAANVTSYVDLKTYAFELAPCFGSLFRLGSSPPTFPSLPTGYVNSFSPC